MEINAAVLLIVIGGAIVTFIPRVVPIMVLSRLKLSDNVQTWLHFVPIAILAAIIGQELLMEDNKVQIMLNEELPAAIITALIAIKTRSLLWTVVAGVIAFVLMRWLLAGFSI